MDKYIGKRLDGRYLVDELVGIGGMANVYKATDVSNGRIVAVKILRDEYVQNGELLRRFKNGIQGGGSAFPPQHRAGIRCQLLRSGELHRHGVY